MKKSAKLFAVVLTLLLLPTLALAASPWTEKATYQEKAAAKFAFGMKNLLFGWSALVTPNRCEMAAEKKECKYCPLTGLYLAIVNTAGGAVHAATFLIPVDVPLPNNGTQFLK